MPPRRKKSKPSDIVSRFAGRLRATRLTQGLTQLDLASAAGVSVAYVGRLEAGAASCTIDVLGKLATALAVTVADLLPTTDPPDTTAQLSERVRTLADQLVKKADPEALALAAQFLARISG